MVMILREADQRPIADVATSEGLIDYWNRNKVT
jgi:hypothetical protein